jgi:integrase
MPRKRRSIRGRGEVYQRPYKDANGRTQLTKTYEISYYRGGKRIREPAGDDYDKAHELLRERLSDRHHGRASMRDKITYEDMEQMLLDDYAKKEQKDRQLRVVILPHLQKHFGGMLAAQIDETTIIRYQAKRKKEKTYKDTLTTGPTVNRETSMLRRMFNIAKKAKKISSVPNIEPFPESKPRKGFFSKAEMLAIKLVATDQNVKTLVELMYLTGWRWESELVSRRWSDIDFNDGEMRLHHGEGKDKDSARVVPLFPDLRACLKAQHDYVRAVEKKTGKIIPWMFVRKDGRQIVSIRKAVTAAFKAAGCGDKIPHDFRRTAVRNLERAGVERSTAKKIVGHKTDSIYERYAIVDTQMLDAAGDKLSKLIANEPEKREKVAEFVRRLKPPRTPAR